MRSRSHNQVTLSEFRRTLAAKRPAVTIVELVIVIMVMGIMAAVAAPAFFQSLLYHRVESAGRRVKADLELARHTARLKSAAQSVTFTAIGYSLSPAIGALDSPDQPYVVDLTAAPYELSKVTASFGNSQTVSFDGYGIPTSSGTVTLTSQGHSCLVTLDGATGQVSITTISAPSSLPAVDVP